MEENKNVENDKVSFTRLEEEIKIEEESRKLHKDNVENFKKSQRPKKKLKNKIIAWILGGTVFASAAASAGFIIHDQTAGNGAFKKEVQTKFEMVDETLTNRMKQDTMYNFLHNQEITHVRFLEPQDSNAEIQVYYNAEAEASFGNYDIKCYAIFDVLLEYYNALVEAEESGNALLYLDALNEIFTHMELTEEKRGEKILFELKEDTEENRVKFNEIFNLNDVVNEDIVRQIGFLPYHVEVVDYHYDSETFKHDYTYKISGISYCETVSENADEVKNHEDLIIESNYNKNHIKTFQRDILFTSSLVNEAGIDINIRLRGDINMIINNRNNPYTIETTLFQEVNLLKMYEDMKDGKFDYKKPDGFNLKEYKQANELENAK